MHKCNKVKLLHNYDAHPNIKLPGIDAQIQKKVKTLVHNDNAHPFIKL